VLSRGYEKENFFPTGGKKKNAKNWSGLKRRKVHRGRHRNRGDRGEKKTDESGKSTALRSSISVPPNRGREGGGKSRLREKTDR